MPPRRRPRSWLAGRLRSAAGAVQRLAGRVEFTGLPSAPPADVPRRFGEPPRHWLDLVAAHAPGLLRELDVDLDTAAPTHDQAPPAPAPLRRDRSGDPAAGTSRPITDRTDGRAAATTGRSDDPPGTGDPRPAARPPGRARDHARHGPGAGGTGNPGSRSDRWPPLIRPATPDSAGSTSRVARSGGAGPATEAPRSGGAGSASRADGSGGAGSASGAAHVGGAGSASGAAAGGGTDGGGRDGSTSGSGPFGAGSVSRAFGALGVGGTMSAPVAPGRDERTAAHRRPTPGPREILHDSGASPDGSVTSARPHGRDVEAYWPGLPDEPGRPGGLPEQPAGGRSPQHGSLLPERHASRHRAGRDREPARSGPQQAPRHPYDGTPRGAEVRRREPRSGNRTYPVEVENSERWPVSAAFPSSAVAPGADPWPALPDDRPLWTVPGRVLDTGHERRLDREQAGG
ncbi:hypothetical protein [Micromonospora sp. NPDC005172]|uniref:hypothetical protein n=1 Tax=Micromonospora sp. NPDC005172 TaxID=3156867 RepID=UPI0033A21156